LTARGQVGDGVDFFDIGREWIARRIRTMPSPGTAELTLQERGILATSAYAAYLDDSSSADRVLVSASPQPVPVTRKRQYYSRGQMYTIKWQDFGQASSHVV